MTIIDSSTRGQRPSLQALFEQLLAQPTVDPSIASHLQTVLSELDAPAAPGSPFLSVLVRTQGQRPEPLKDALLCLAAQTDEDFEVLLLVHDAEEQALASIDAVVAAYPQTFRSRVRLVPVSGGGRGRPLNVGIEQARGSYLAVFDDDDLLMADWVERFHEAARTTPGKVLRAGAALQAVDAALWPDGREGFSTGSWPAAEYRLDFDVARNFERNQMPFMALAFPATFFSKLGNRVDEELPVCEDWDLIVRASSLCGITALPVLTSVYRKWESGRSSYSVHELDEWKQAELRVVGKADSTVQLLPPGTATRISELLEHENAAPVLRQVTSSLSWRITEPLRGVRGVLGRVRHRLRRR